jgi:hypothetical protein
VDHCNHCHNVVKVKVMLSIGMPWRHLHWPPYASGNIQCAHGIGDCVGAKANLDTLEKRKLSSLYCGLKHNFLDVRPVV